MKDMPHHAGALAALGHEARLGIYRLLVRAGQEGLRVGEISKLLNLPASTLSHHLTTLVAAGLVLQRKQGREVISRADYEAMNALILFLTDECCEGVGSKAKLESETV
jgi:DNA-binding transcriptional ArsR family regulator